MLKLDDEQNRGIVDAIENREARLKEIRRRAWEEGWSPDARRDTEQQVREVKRLRQMIRAGNTSPRETRTRPTTRTPKRNR